MTNILKLAPIKMFTKKKIPDSLIFEPFSNKYSFYKKFELYNTKGHPNEKASMEVYKSRIDRDGYEDVPSLYIDNIVANVKGKGLGTRLIEFAKQYSKRIGCQGNIHLDAAKIEANTPSPHIFYRKNGFSTHSEELNRELDASIKNKSNKYFAPTEMFYPQEKTR